MAKGLKDVEKAVEEAFERHAPPLVLAIGSVIWKVTAWASNIEFLISIPSRSFNLMLEFFLNYGWWVVTGIGIIWYLWVRNKQRTYPVGPGMVAVVGFLCFIYGILVAVHASGGVPRVITFWGQSNDNCLAAFDTSKLTGFRKTDDIALICGVHDAGIDMFNDTAISVSIPYTILPGSFRVMAPFSEATKKKIKTQAMVSIWHEAVLIPKNTDMSSIHKLSDVVKYNGKVLNPAYYE